MKILLTSHYALPHSGGIEAVVDGLARGFTEHGHDVVHVASSALRPGEAGSRAAAYRVCTYAAWNGLESRLGVPYPVFSPSLWPGLLRELRRCDVLHAHGMLSEASFAALMLSRRVTSTPSVLTEHVGHVPFRRSWLNAVEAAAIGTMGRMAARSASAIVVLNPEVRALMARLAPGREIHTIRNGIDLSLYRPAASSARQRLRQELGWDEVPRVLFVGRLVEKKGVSAAVESARLAQGRFRLVLAGPGHIDLPAGSHVEVLGALPPEDVATLYRAADALLLPSRGEGFPLAVQEAMASGLPVILARDERYETTLAGSGAAATLVEPVPRSIADAVQTLLANPERLEQARLDAVEFATENFARERSIREHLALYEELCGAAGARA